MEEKILSMTNEYGKKFVANLLGRYKFLGIEEKDDNRKEIFVIVERDEKIYAIVLPMASSIDDGCCFFGSLDYFAIIQANNKAGLKTYWSVSDNPIHPKWYLGHDDEKLHAFVKEYRRILDKYSH